MSLRNEFRSFDPPPSAALDPDLDAARRHIELLTGDAASVVSWQVFDDNKTRQDRGLAKSWHATLDAALPRLREAQARGCGVYIAVNQTDGRSRRIDAMKSAWAVFLDMDGAPLPKEWPIAPDLLVHSSGIANGGQAHIIEPWRIDDGALQPTQFSYQPPIAAVG